jgi:hypothetical protein
VLQGPFRIAPCCLLIIIDLDIARRTDADLQLEVPAAVDDPIIVIGVASGAVKTEHRPHSNEIRKKCAIPLLPLVRTRNACCQTQRV